MAFWKQTYVTGLFENYEQKILKNHIKQLLKENDLDESCCFSIYKLKDRNWEREWLKNFKPKKYGERLWVCPTNLNGSHKDIVVKIDPGLAFGTGTHPTTDLCLTWLDKENLEGKKLVDFGCGSGILAIAALKLGAKEAFGIDHDQQAILASKSNAEKNNVTSNLKLSLYAPKKKYSADILIANIVTNTLLKEKDNFLKLTKKNSEIIFSGILKNQIEIIREAFEKDLIFLTQQEKEGWILMHMRKK